LCRAVLEQQQTQVGIDLWVLGKSHQQTTVKLKRTWRSDVKVAMNIRY
jgi:hypothetical protein